LVVSEDSSEADASSRRWLLRAAGAGLGGMVAAACGHQSLRTQVHNAKPVLHSNVALLNHLLDLEHMAIAAYTAGTPLLSASVFKAGRLFLNDEISHAGDLAGLVKAFGGKPVKPAPSYALGHPHTSDEVLALLHKIEQAQIAAYLETIPRLRPGVVKQQVASILANDAQHVAVVRAALGQPAVPSPFVTGRE
jgi:bacterioferritin (cytochrome b1)